jgi:hypothetical protein
VAVREGLAANDGLVLPAVHDERVVREFRPEAANGENEFEEVVVFVGHSVVGPGQVLEVTHESLLRSLREGERVRRKTRKRRENTPFGRRAGSDALSSPSRRSGRRDARAERRTPRARRRLRANTCGTSCDPFPREGSPSRREGTSAPKPFARSPQWSPGGVPEWRCI